MALKNTRPKNTKFNKHFRPHLKFKHKESKLLYTGGLLCMESSLITDNQLGAIVLTLKRILKRRGKIICRVFPHQSITKKPIQTRMGKGKGSICNWVQTVQPGSMIVEINLKSSGSGLLIRTALKSIQNKVPFKSKIILENSGELNVDMK